MPTATIEAPAKCPHCKGKMLPVPLASCTVGGCPGKYPKGASCPCCAARAAWVAEHWPKRECEICHGEIGGTRRLRYCEACAPVAQKVAIASTRTPAKAGKK